MNQFGKIIGAVIFVAGVVLWCGNVFGFLVTFPFVGYGTAILGGFIWRKSGEDA